MGPGALRAPPQSSLRPSATQRAPDEPRPLRSGTRPSGVPFSSNFARGPGRGRYRTAGVRLPLPHSFSSPTVSDPTTRNNRPDFEIHELSARRHLRSGDRHGFIVALRSACRRAPPSAQDPPLRHDGHPCRRVGAEPDSRRCGALFLRATRLQRPAPDHRSRMRPRGKQAARKAGGTEDRIFGQRWTRIGSRARNRSPRRPGDSSSADRDSADHPLSDAAPEREAGTGPGRRRETPLRIAVDF